MLMQRSVIIMNPNNGEILAMSNKPDFNPNKPYDGAENFSGNTSSDRIQKCGEIDLFQTPSNRVLFLR